MNQATVEGRPVPIRMRDRAQRRLIRRVVERLAQHPECHESFGRLVRVAHLTALTALPLGMNDALAERRLLRACLAQVQAERTTHRRPAAA